MCSTKSVKTRQYALLACSDSGTFTVSGRSAAFAFSLKQSDHHRAGYMVRKLNLLLHEISLKPESTMTNKEALEKLFQSGIKRMNEHMENLQFAGQRFGSGFQNLGNMIADIEVGWAYRLLEKFGTRSALICLGRFILLARRHSNF